MSRLASVLAALVLVAAAHAGQPEHVFVISVDGLRGDLVDRADTPYLDLLVRSGTRARAARTVRPAVTLPAHASMLCGVVPQAHGFLHNRHEPARGPFSRRTLLSVAADQGRDVAAFVGKKKLLPLLPEGRYRGGHMGYHDGPVMRRAIAEISRKVPHLSFIHLPDVDAAGHAHGWGSPQQIEAVAGADAAIGRLFQAVHASGVLRRSSFLVLADHGGHGTAHGLHHPLEFQIEWVAAGLGFHPGAVVEAPVSVLDTMPTVLTVMGLEVPDDIEGRVVSEALFFGDRDVDAEAPVQLGLGPEDLLPEARATARPRWKLAARPPASTPRPAPRPLPVLSNLPPARPARVRIDVSHDAQANAGLLPPFGAIDELARSGRL